MNSLRYVQFPGRALHPELAENIIAHLPSFMLAKAENAALAAVATRLPPTRPQVTNAAIEEARRILRELESRVRNSGTDDYEF
ncbi:hypothetical protein N7488_001911 [Penicillium malachiteum]|nr:hypothetical protein N7488_001911 [Penicillium malachiteum]